MQIEIAPAAERITSLISKWALTGHKEITMSELRWNPLLREWVATATHRMDRPQLPKDSCPFCPASGRVPEKYDVYIYPNDFPTFSLLAQNPAIKSDGIYQVAESKGACDVVLYHPNHNVQPSALSSEHWTKIIKLWQERFRELAALKAVKYVFIFENKGEVIGVTMPHPHGQIYAFPYVPPRIERELQSANEFYRKQRECLLCNILGTELDGGSRVIVNGNHFVAFVPFFARWPYEVHIYPRRHVQYITQLDEHEIRSLARTLKTVLMKYDRLYGFPFPYMMVQHAAPVAHETSYDYFHWHVEYYPPYRSATKLKYLAGCESGAGTFINDSLAEEKAAELRNVSVEID
jgi:UDPglucose--hexose-1-phosphate uridylyltransferase